MKGPNNYGPRGRQISFSLIALIFFTTILYAWEKNPFVSVDQITIRSAGLLVGAPGDSSEIEKAEKLAESNISVSTREGTGKEDDSAATTPSERKDNDERKTRSTIMQGASSDSSETKKVVTHSGVSDTQLITGKGIKKEEDGFTNLGETKKEEDSSPNLTPTSSETEDKDEQRKSSPVNKVCNYAKGKWVADSRHPLYSGLGCKQWLSAMWACRLTQRTDFSYEGYHWQPESCEMPEFERSAFLKRMQDKTIAFVGDSLGRQQFQSLMCMATGGEESPEVQDVGWEYGLVKARGAVRPDGWAYRFPKTNTTILYYWSASLSDLVPVNISDPASDVAMHLDRPPAFLKRYLHRFDVLVLNTGHHWNRGKLRANRWVMYVDGKPLKDRKLQEIGNAKNFTVYSIVRWVDSQLPSHPSLKAFFRTISPRHFSNGDWNTGGRCDNTSPLSHGSEVTQDGSSDHVVEGAVKGTKVKILDITALSELRDEGHISHYSIKANQGINDCLHWCLPGIPDTWNEILYAQI